MAESEPDKQDDKPQDPDKAPHIIVDDDWKTQAQAEKERLAKEVEGQEAGAPAAGAEGAPGQRPTGPRELPPASFSTLVTSLATQVFMSLGGVEDPRTKRRLVDLALARHHIDTLSVLEEKTKGNLTDDEKKLLDRALYETRMQYVQIAQRVS